MLILGRFVVGSGFGRRLTIEMNSDVTFLFEFLERTGPEVSGRQSAEPEFRVAQMLERFARGECDPDERAEVCQMLRLNPRWLHWLASRVVQARGLGREDSEAAAS